MNNKIKQYLIDYFKKSGERTDDEWLQLLIEMSKSEYFEKIDFDRWYDKYFRVVKIGDRLIGFENYYSRVYDEPLMGETPLDFDTLCEVEKVDEIVETKTIYKKIAPKQTAL